MVIGEQQNIFFANTTTKEIYDKRKPTTDLTAVGFISVNYTDLTIL